jgi:hypothetical protein
MDLPVVEKPIPAIPINYGNQTVIIKACEEEIKISHKNEKLWSVCTGLYPNI